MSALPDMSTGSVTVIGDVMLDRFWSGASRRVSPEAPVPVVSVMGQEDRSPSPRPQYCPSRWSH